VVLKQGPTVLPTAVALRNPRSTHKRRRRPGAGSVSTQETPPSPYRSLRYFVGQKRPPILATAAGQPTGTRKEGQGELRHCGPARLFPLRFQPLRGDSPEGPLLLQANGDLPHANVRGSRSHDGRHLAPSRPRLHRVIAARMYARQAPCASVIFLAPVLPGKCRCLASPDIGGRVTRQARHTGHGARGAGRGTRGAGRGARGAEIITAAPTV